MMNVSLRQHVAFAANGEEENGFSIAEFGTEVGDVHVDGPCLGVVGFETPDAAEEFISGDGAATMGAEVFEEVGFPFGDLGACSIVEAQLHAGEIGDAAWEGKLLDGLGSLR
jgi:hypothetical protein